MPEVDPQETRVGTVLEDKYRLVSVISEGGMGTVYEALQLRLKKRMAIKLMSSELTRDPASLARFRREADITSALGHPHIVSVVDYGLASTGEPYLVMEYLEGEDLEHCLQREGRLELSRAFRVVRQVASALAAAHHMGVVHRDLKPANIFLVNVSGEDDFVKVVDFGISKVLSDLTKLTQAHVVIGTPHYMSPEQATGRSGEVDQRTDQWALACIAWEMLCGRCPFESTSSTGVLHQVISAQPPSLLPLVPGLGPEVESVLQRALSKKPRDRFPSIRAFARALRSAGSAGLPTEDTPTPQPQPTGAFEPPTEYTPWSEKLGSADTQPEARPLGSLGGAPGQVTPRLRPGRWKRVLTVVAATALLGLGVGATLAWLLGEARPTPTGPAAAPPGARGPTPPPAAIPPPRALKPAPVPESNLRTGLGDSADPRAKAAPESTGNAPSAASARRAKHTPATPTQNTSAKPAPARPTRRLIRSL